MDEQDQTPVDLDAVAKLLARFPATDVFGPPEEAGSQLLELARYVAPLTAEVERLRKALGEVDNLASGAVRFGRQVRKEAQAALGWDHDAG